MNLLGVFLGIGCIVLTMILEGTHPTALINLPAFIIVVGTTVCCTLVQFSISDILGAAKAFLWIIAPPRLNLLSQAELLTGLSTTARQQGLLALESSIGSANDEYTRTGILMIVDGVDKQTLSLLMENAIDIEQAKLEVNAKYFEALGGYSPTMGIIGAVLGLIHAMSLLDQPDLLGPAIAVAFVATIYGLVVANLISIPASNRLRSINSQIAMYKYMTLEALVSIAAGEHTMMLKRRVSLFTGKAPE